METNLIKIQNMGVYWPSEGVSELNTPLLRYQYTSQKQNLMETRWGRLCGTMNSKLGLDICIVLLFVFALCFYFHPTIRHDTVTSFIHE